MIICSGCGKLIEKDFFYCPWCGVSRVANDTKDADELRILKYKQNQKEMRDHQFEVMAEQLDDLEKELSVLVLSAEMSK